MIRHLIAAAVTGVLSICGCLAELPEGKVTVRVVDEDGAPLAGAEATVAFQVPQKDGSGEGKDVSKFGITGRDGLFSMQAEMLPSIAYGAKLEGYYLSTNLQADLRPVVVKGSAGGDIGPRYEPWNPTLDVVLRRIVNPVPMYARHVRSALPEANEDVGFDLVAGDWVAPFGKGSEKDFIFHLKKEFKAKTDYSAHLEIKFSNAADGIQSIYADGQHGSLLRLPRLAPINGYEATWLRQTSSNSPMLGRRDQNYFFRVRTIKKDKKIVRAMYGKLYGEIQFDVINAKTADLIFTYYLNPDGTENLEFDPKRNLFRLNQNESVSEP